MTIPLGRSLPNASRDQPGRRREDALAVEMTLLGVPPLFGLAPGGVYPAVLRCRRRGALLPHPFTLTAGKRRRFAFCGTIPRVAPAGRYPAPYFPGARTFLSPAVADKKSGHPAVWQRYH